MDLNENEEATVILGAHNYYDNGEAGRLRLKSRKYWIHENFSMPFAENDIGLLELPYAINFTDQIRPIKLSTDKNFDGNGTEREIIVILSGWGYKDADYQPAEILQTARMKVIPYDDCIKFKSHYVEKLTRNHICAMGQDNRPGQAVLPCDGDSGRHSILFHIFFLMRIDFFFYTYR
jgi:Trypsin